MQSLTYLLIGIAIVLGMFLLLRQIVLWYWKINEHIEITKESRDYLKEIAAATTYLARQGSVESRATNRLADDALERHSDLMEQGNTRRRQ